MNNRRSLTEEQLSEDEVYKLYYKYIMELAVESIIGACYIRVSTHEQDKFSPLSQLKEILEYALQHHVYIPKEFIFQDIGKSGMKDIEKRTDFFNMIETAKNQKFQTLLLYKFSRLARSKEDSVYYKAKLRKEYNINVISIREALPDDNSRVLVESIYEGQDEFYVLNFRDETKRGKKEKATRGEWLNCPPYGYKFDRNTQTLVIVEEHAKIVNLMFKRLQNNSSLNGLVTELNSSKIPSPRGQYWSSRTVKRILQNPAYLGYIRYSDGGFKRNYDSDKITLFKGLHKPIIEPELFNEVQIKMKEIASRYKKYAKPQSHNSHWLSSILKCDNCGHSLTRSDCCSRKYPFFQCSGYHKGACNISHHIKESVAISLILDQIKKDFTEKLEINITQELENFSNKIILLESELKEFNTKLERVKTAYENGVDSLIEYKEKKEKISKQINKTLKEIKKVKSEITQEENKNIIYDKCAKAYEILSDENAPMELKKDISNNLFDKIIYDKKQEKLIIYYKI